MVDVGALVCSEDQFSCGRDGNVTRCIPNAHVCDGHPDCPSALDELHCKNTSLHLDFKFALICRLLSCFLLLSLVRELNIVLFLWVGAYSPIATSISINLTQNVLCESGHFAMGYETPFCSFARGI